MAQHIDVHPLAQAMENEHPGSGKITTEAYHLAVANGTLADFWKILINNMGPTLVQLLLSFIASQKPPVTVGS